MKTDRYFFDYIWPGTGLIWIALVAFTAAAVRLFNLDQLGPFIDESIHIYFFDKFSIAQRFSIGGKLFGSLLFYYTTRWAEEPLYASRMLIAAVGVLTTIGVSLVTERLAGRIAAVVAGVLWALLPFVTFHDRLALHDPLISFFIIWSIFFLLEALRENSWTRGLLSGLAMGLAILTKPTALIGIVWLILIYLTYILLKKINSHSKVMLSFLAGSISPLAVMSILLILNLQEFIEYVGRFSHTSAESLSRWQVFTSNLIQINNWISGYNTPYFSLLVLLSFAVVVAQPSPAKIALMLSFLISLVVHTLLFRVWFARYFIPSLLPLVILIGITLAESVTKMSALWKNCSFSKRVWLHSAYPTLLWLLFLLAIPSWLSKNITLQTAPRQVQIPIDDQLQYLHDWSSGAGVKNVANFLEILSQNSSEEILVVTGGFGTQGFWSIPTTIQDSSNIEFVFDSLGQEEKMLKVLSGAVDRPTLILFEIPAHASLEEMLLNFVSPSPSLVFEYERDKTTGGFRVYQLAANSQLRPPNP